MYTRCYIHGIFDSMLKSDTKICYTIEAHRGSKEDRIISSHPISVSLHLRKYVNKY